jgi:hypothetical protein
MKMKLHCQLLITLSFLGTTTIYAQSNVIPQIKIESRSVLEAKPQNGKLQSMPMYEKNIVKGLYAETMENIAADTFLFPSSPLTSTNITLLLSLDYGHAAWKMSSANGESNTKLANNIKLKENSVQALDFLEGFNLALKSNPPFFNFNINVVDATTNDSILREKLNEATVKNSDIIIGPGKVSSAKIVAEYCKQNKKINIQPFVAANTIGLENPYLVKLSPTIEGHMLRMYQTVVDSFPNAKVIIYTTKRERDYKPAKYIDSLFNEYNLTASKKILKAFVNTGDESKSASQRSLSANMGGGRQNVIIYCSYDQVNINQTLRSLSRGEAIVFGMPTWVDQELIRADYLNNAELHFTDAFYADSADAQNIDFKKQYGNTYAHPPSVDSYMGYDVANYLSYALKLHGYNFAQKSLGELFKGIGYHFVLGEHLAKVKDSNVKTFQYYTNESVSQYKIIDYKIIHCD